MEGPGTEVEREGEETLTVRDIGFPHGTAVEVRDLFFNLPARQKFLHSDQSELGQIVKFLTNVALAYPGLRISLSHSVRNILSCPPVGSLKERIFQLYGKSFLERLMEVDYGEGETRLCGFTSLPPLGRPDRTHQFFFVNLRPVRDKILSSALSRAYKGLLEKALSAEAILFLKVPYGDVDVNVHPAKAEVRFRQSSLVFQTVLRGIEKGRLKVSGIKEIAATPPGNFPGDSPDEVHLRIPFKVAERETRFGSSLVPLSGLPPGPEEAPARRILGQFADSYIVAEDADGLLIIDQHNAHERVLFDKYADIDRRRKWPAKMSLIPLLFDLSPSQAVGLEAHQELLQESGFRIEPMGGRSFALREFPDIFKPDEALSAVLSLLEEMKESPAEQKKERLLATMACKTAIKAGQPLSLEKIEFLLQELSRSSNPALCPHGRPIQVKIPRSQIDKGLKRPSG